MQRQKGAVGSLSETFFDQGSTSSNAVIDQQVHWNNIPNPVENRFPDCLLLNNDINIGYVNSIGREEQEACRWSLEEPSSSGTPNEVNHNERKMDHGWSSSMSSSAGPMLNERQYERNTPFVQYPNANTVSQSINLNASLIPHVNNNSQVTEWSNLCKPNVSERNLNLYGAGPEGFLLTSKSGGYVVDDNNSRPGEGCRASCKRKTLEGNVEQSSLSESSSCFHCAESSAGHGVPTSSSVGSSVNLSVPSEQAHPRLGLDVGRSASDTNPELTVLAAAKSSQRNCRLRISPPSIHRSITPPIFSSSQQSPRLLPTDHSLHLRSAPVVDNANPRIPNVAVHVPTLRRNMQPFRWNGGSGSRTGNSSSSNVARDRDVVPHEGHQSRSMPRNLLDHPIFVHAPEMRTLVRNPTNRDVNSGNLSVPGNFASSSHAGSSSGANASSVPTWAPQPNNPSQFPRRLSGLVPRSLMSSLGPESGDLGNHSSLPSRPSTSPEEMLLSYGVANPGHRLPCRRLVSWLESQEAEFLGIPHSLRNLAATDGRRRLVVPEDFMILDQSAFFGVAGIHDRHRDMRLDVDNMSYEELLALEERIGNVNTGLSEEAILSQLKRRKYSSLGTQLETEPCSVCQEEYNDGEDLATLECGHDFHADCIKQWLMHKNLCPICKTTGMNK